MNHITKQLEKGSYEELEVKIKLKVFCLMHYILQNNICNTFLYCIFVTIENLQFLYYPVHPRIGFLWQNDALEYFRQVLRYFQFNYLIDQNEQILIILLYSSFATLVIFWTMWMLLQRKVSNLQFRERPSSTTTFFLKIMSIFTIALNVVFGLPFYNIFLAVAYCTNETQLSQYLECYTGVSVLHTIVGCIGLIMTLMLTTTVTLLFFDLNPKSKFPFVGFQSDTEYYKLLCKIILPFLSIFNASGSFNSEMVVVIGCGYLILLYFRYIAPTAQNLFIHWYKIMLEIVILWVTICCIITNFLDVGDPDDMGLVYMFVMIPPVVFGGLYFFKQRRKESLIFIIKQLKNDAEADYYLAYLLHLLHNREETINRVKLFGMLKLHFVKCTRPECACQQLIKIDHTKEESAFVTKLWVQFYQGVLEEIIEKFEDVARFRIFYAYVANDEIGNKFNALHNMMKAEDKKANWREEFCIFRFKSHIEQQMQEEADRGLEIDVNEIVDFQNQLVMLSAQIEKSVESHLEFWRELQEDNPNIVKLQNIGIKVLNSIDVCTDSYDTLLELNASHLSLLEEYAMYINKVVNDRETFNVLNGVINSTKKQIFKRQSANGIASKITESQDTIIVTMSGNYNNIGIVFSCNNEIYNSLEYFATDLVGQNISRLMPKCIADAHDSIVIKYLETSQSSVIGMERQVFAQNKSGYIVPTKLLVKVLPNLYKGIMLVGFLQPLPTEKQTHYLMYDATNLQILSISTSMKQFGLTAEMLLSQSVAEQSLEVLFKELVEQINTAKGDWNQVYLVENDKKVESFIDGGQLRQMYLSNMQESAKKRDPMMESQVSMQEQKYLLQRMKVIIHLIDDRQFDFTQVHTIMIKEIEEVHEFDHSASIVKQRRVGMQDKPATIEEKQEEQLEGMEEKDDIVGSSVAGDDERQAKDIRSIIEQNITPKQVAYLRYVSVILLISLLALSISNLVMHLDQSNVAIEGITSIKEAYMRHSMMADVNLYCRYLQLVGRGFLDNSLEQPYKNNISVLADALQTIQFNMIDYRIKIEQRSGETMHDELYEIQFLLSNNETKSYNNLFNEAMFAFITAASSLKKASMASFIDASNSSSTQKNLFFVMQNGLQVLRNGSEAQAVNFFNYYQDTINTFDNDIIIILSLGISIVIICNLIFIPIFKDINKEKKLLLSYFGLIPNEDIVDLIDAGDNYLKDYIRKYSEMQDELLRHDTNGLTIQNLNQSRERSEEQEDNVLQDDVIPLDKVELFTNKHESKTQKVKSGQASPKKHFGQKEEKNLRIFYSQGSSNYLLIFLLSFCAAIIIGDLTYTYLFQADSLSDTKNIMAHYQYNVERPSVLKYNILFTLEALNNQGDILEYLGIDINDYYNDKVYELEQELFRSVSTTYPVQFDSYFSYFNQVNFLNLCDEIQWIQKLDEITASFIFVDPNTNQTKFQPTELTAECAVVKGGLLTKGLRDALFLVSLGNKELLAAYEDLQISLDSYTFKQMDLLRKYILPTLWENNSYFKDSFDQFIQVRNMTFVYNFIAFIFYLVVGFIIIWIPYVRSVQSSIWQSLRMLTIIPQELLIKCPALKAAIELHIIKKQVQI